ncbi:Ubiquitin carboxyl-terminal hydrolase [Balamuthia mandrillaris]
MSDSNWCTIESDPGVFTELLEEIGVKGVQVEEIYSLDEETLYNLQPVYGLIFLFKWQQDASDSRPICHDTDIFFAHQVINNACATQAILSILLNRDDVDIGDELRGFKDFAGGLPPEMRGLAISNSDLIRKVHNSFARPEPFLFSSTKVADENDDVYHFISYIPYKGRLFELDGLKRGPICHGDCTPEDWLAKVGPIIQQRIEKYARSEIRFNLMAIIKDRSALYNSQIESLNQQKEELHQQLESSSSSSEELSSQLAAIEEEIIRCTEAIKENEEKKQGWKMENIRRKHNYIPFIMNLLKVLVQKGELPAMIEKAKQKESETRKRKTTNKK